jgi:hypothetical protein
MTTVTTLKGVVTGDNFPVLTKYGIIKYSLLGKYLNRMSENNFDFTDEQINSLMAFFDSGYNDGWIDKLMYVLPFIGSAETYKAAAVPLIDRFSNYKELRIAASNRGLDYNSDFSKYFKVDADNKVIATVPYRTDMMLVMNLSPYDVFMKTEKNTYKNNGNYGVSWYGRVTTKGELCRILQCSGFTVNNLMGFSAVGQAHLETFGRQFIYQTVGDLFFTGKAKLYNNNIKLSGKNIIEWRIYDGDFVLISNNESADRDDYSTLPETELSKNLLFGLNGAWNNLIKACSQISLTSGLETRYLAFTDGSLNAGFEESYNQALKTLLQTFGKLY